MAIKKNVTNRDVRDNLVEWIRKGIEFSTPVRDTGMYTMRHGYCGGLRTASISGRVEEDAMQNPVYVVYSYETPIMRVMFEDPNEDCNYVPCGAEFDFRMYSATTNTMQGFCYSSLMNLFGLPLMPCVLGKRGGRYFRRNFMVVYGDKFKGFEWGVLDTNKGIIVPIRVDGDPYNGDTEGYY